ncbi:acyl carrier protein [Candidatus Parcubacteria bacterium]|nr:MAG: acyl carrier protein [Candidatus Parcubacteria bacterium]
MKSFEIIVTEQLKIPAADIRPELTPKDVPEWDSMNYLLFIADLEKEYGVVFDMQEVLSMQSLGDVMGALRKKGIEL